ncbi:HEPN domain-containing protein [Pseudomonas putida]|uniref:HEPN domain-containing protein n=1 Tax=Pseudomonas TaxID=286 RepID=UPI00346597AB
MERINEAFIRTMDDKLIDEDVYLHQRPFRIVAEWMTQHGLEGDFLDERIWGPLMEDYRKLYPTGDFSIPALLKAGVAMRDRFYPVRVNVGLGTYSIQPFDMIEVSRPELERIFKNYPDIGWAALYGVCDLWDFAYGVDDLRLHDTPAVQQLKNAQSAIASTASILSQTLDTDSAVQTCCLAAELSLKGVLLHLGVDAVIVRNYGHNLRRIAEKLSQLRPNANDIRLLEACENFPNYVNSRYSAHGLTKVQLLALAMRAQFVAAEAVRRISERNLAGQVEAGEGMPRPGFQIMS